MDSRNLHAFVIAAEEENLHRAAARLHITQSALSRRIKALELELGNALFERIGRGVRLSEVGRVYLRDAREILRLIQEAGERSRSAAMGQVGNLRIGLNPTAVRKSMVLRTIRSFKARHPGINLSLSQMNSPRQLDALTAGDIDAGFVFNLPSDNILEFDRVKIGEAHYVLAVPKNHRLAKASNIALKDLRDEQFIWLDRSSNPSMHDRLMNECLRGGFSPNIVQHVLAWNTILDLVAIGMGLGFVVSSTRDFDASVTLRKVKNLSVPIRFDLAWRRDNLSPVLSEFIGFAKSAFKTGRLDPRT